LQGPNQWPEALPDLKPVALGWLDATSRLAIRLLRAFAVALGQPEDLFAPIYARDPNLLIKLIRYPGREATQDHQGVGPDNDGGFLTLLLPDVQSEAADGNWIDAPARRQLCRQYRRTA
jgi:isopenicillin N synthase-like dioxygenase